MAEARQRDEWTRTASVMALVANTQRDPKKTRPLRPSDFDPFSGTGGRAGQTRGGVIPAPVSVLKDVFIKKEGIRDQVSGIRKTEQGGARED